MLVPAAAPQRSPPVLRYMPSLRRPNIKQFIRARPLNQVADISCCYTGCTMFTSSRQPSRSLR